MMTPAKSVVSGLHQKMEDLLEDAFNARDVKTKNKIRKKVSKIFLEALEEAENIEESI